VVAYLKWVAIEKPMAFAPILAKVLPPQPQVVEEKEEVVYRTVEEVKADLAKRAIRLDRLLPILNAPPPVLVDEQTDDDRDAPPEAGQQDGD
jgi:hypothetical protein